jgi:hypothetical protein
MITGLAAQAKASGLSEREDDTLAPLTSASTGNELVDAAITALNMPVEYLELCDDNDGDVLCYCSTRESRSNYSGSNAVMRVNDHSITVKHNSSTSIYNMDENEADALYPSLVYARRRVNNEAYKWAIGAIAKCSGDVKPAAPVAPVSQPAQTRADDIAKLVALWYEVISGLHHKDRDCHFRIVSEWSYNGKHFYSFEHDGYLGGAIDGRSPNMIDVEACAANYLAKKIIAYINHEDSILTDSRRTEILAQLPSLTSWATNNG